MRIAICDDDIRFAGKMERLLEECVDSTSNCDVFLSAEELLKRAEKERYQLYLLDIEMKELSGMEAAKRIRIFDENALIVFVTSYIEKMPEAFDVNAFHYLVKPINEEKVREVITRAVQRLEEHRRFFSLQMKHQNHMMEYDRLKYLESQGRKVCVHTTDGRVYEYYGTLKEALKKLDEKQFVQIHQAYVVNLDKVDRFGKEQLVMQGDENLSISRTYRKIFLSVYQEYVLRGLHR